MQNTYAQWLRYGAYTVLVLAVVVGGYYFVYVQQRTEQLANDRLDLLRESASYFTEELGRVKRNIQNTLQDDSKVSSIKDLAPALAEIAGVDTSGVKNVSPTDWTSMRPISIDSTVIDTSSSDSISVDTISAQTGCRRRSQDYETGSDDGIELVTTFESTVDHPLLTFNLTKGKELPCPLASSNINHLLRPLLPRSETAFDKVVLVRENGRVLVSSGKGPISIENLPLHEQGPVTRKATRDTARGRYSEIFTMEAAGLSYRVFLQPFRVPVDIDYPGGENDSSRTAREGEEEILYLAGVKQEQAFRAEARKLPPTLLAILMCVVAFVLLAFPFLEVWLIGPTESFQAHDVLEVAVGVVIASSIVTLAGLSFFSVGQLEDRQFNQLEKFSDVIRTTLHTEAKAANQQLTHLTSLVRQCDSNCKKQTQIWKGSIFAPETTKIKWRRLPFYYYTRNKNFIKKLERKIDSSIVFSPARIGAYYPIFYPYASKSEYKNKVKNPRHVTIVDSSKVISDSLHYPPLEMASWIDEKANQVAKWSVEDQTTPLINLSDRGYVRAHEAALGQPWSSSQHSEVWEYPEGDSTEWVLESIRSKNTGEVFAQISRRPEPGIEFGRNASNFKEDTLKFEEIKRVREDTVFYDNLNKKFDVADTVLIDSVDKEIVARDTTTAVVAAATLPLLSVIEPVLPPGFRFAVIDRGGKVLFHSDTRRNLRENIFDKIIGAEHLRDAVFARRADRATAQYREDTYQFYAHPVSDSPWTLLVFADLQPLRAMHGQILTTGLVLYIGYLFLLLIALILWMTASSKVDRFRLQGLFYALWPDEESDESYQSLFWGEVGLLFVGLGFFLLALWGGFSMLLFGMCLLGTVALLLFCQYCSGGGAGLHDLLGLGSRLRRLQKILGVDGPYWRNHYVASLIVLVLNVGVLPVMVSYTVLHDESAELLTKKNQLTFAERLQDRGEKWVDHYRGIALNDTARDSLNAHLFESPFWPPIDATVHDTTKAQPPWDVHTVPGHLEVENDSSSCNSKISGRQPVYNVLSSVQLINGVSLWGHNLHTFSDFRSSDSSWTSTSNGRVTSLCMEKARRAGLPQPGQESPDRGDLVITSSVPTLAALFGQDPGLAVLGILVFGVLFVVVLWWALRTLHTQIFFMDLASVVDAGGASGSTADQSGEPDRILHLRGRPEGAALDASMLRGDGTEDGLIETAGEADAPVVVENFHDGLDDAEGAERKRALLEALDDLDEDVTVYSDVDPLPYLIDRFYEDDASTPTPIDLEAWATALRPFRKKFSSPKTKDGDEASLDDVVERECGVDPYLDDHAEDIRRAVLGDREETSLTREQVEEQVKYHARSHYHHLWMTCTDEEKVILHRLSTDGFVSPHARPTVKQLLRRGLVVLGPELRPMNESFRRFVADLDSPIIAQYEKKASSTAWNRVRVPLLLGFGLVLAFIFLTQPDLVKEWMGTLAPALAAGLPVLLNVASGLIGGKGSTPGSGGQ